MKRTPLKRSGPITRRTPMPRAAAPMARRPMARRVIRRDWTAATSVTACRVCGLHPAALEVARVERAHILGRNLDTRMPDGTRRVEPNTTVALCVRWDGQGCHTRYDKHALNLRPYLTDTEWATAVALVGEGPALRRVMGAEWRETT